MKYVVNINTGESSRYRKGEEYRVIISNPTSSYDITQLDRSKRDAELNWYKKQLSYILFFKKNNIRPDLFGRLKELMSYKREIINIDISKAPNVFPEPMEDIISESLFITEKALLEDRIEQERLAKIEAARLEEERLAKLEEERLEEERKVEEARLEEIRKAEEARLLEARLESERLAKIEEARLEEERLAEEARLEEERLAEEARLEEERLAEEARLEEERLAEEARFAEEVRLAVAKEMEAYIDSLNKENI